jgi:hypothetical protein
VHGRHGWLVVEESGDFGGDHAPGHEDVDDPDDEEEVEAFVEERTTSAPEHILTLSDDPFMSGDYIRVRERANEDRVSLIREGSGAMFYSRHRSFSYGSIEPKVNRPN